MHQIKIVSDTFQLKCVPGAEQECPEGFGSGDPETCFAETLVNGELEWECPEDYHSVEDDETGQCNPDEEGCPEGMIWTGKTGESHNACNSPYSVCDEIPEHEVCREYCKEFPDGFGCKPAEAGKAN